MNQTQVSIVPALGAPGYEIAGEKCTGCLETPRWSSEAAAERAADLLIQIRNAKDVHQVEELWNDLADLAARACLNFAQAF